MMDKKIEVEIKSKKECQIHQRMIDTIVAMQKEWPMPEDGWKDFVASIEHTNEKRGWNLRIKSNEDNKKMNKVSVFLPNHEMARLKALGIYRGVFDMSENLRYTLNFTTNAIADILEGNIEESNKFANKMKAAKTRMASSNED